ncbi:BMC domain-containing protein [Clostridium sp. MT-14]|uniref:BMC domain-containing protein n=1 Tax=Clostridium sp. MT-14 TaxID=3348360 RepID=UPI0035F42CCF
MNGEALGIIETIGMAAAIEAADSCVKSANVTLIGYELTRGRGLVTIKIKGDVGAVKAAINAAKVSAGKVNGVYSTLVIPRPAENLDSIIESKETVGLEKKREKAEDEDTDSQVKIGQNEKLENSNSQKPHLNEKNGDIQKEANLSEEIEEEGSTDVVEETVPERKQTVKVQNDDSSKEKKNEEDNKEVCNICHDPQCPRKKGQPRNLCIHYKNHGKAIENDGN